MDTVIEHLDTEFDKITRAANHLLHTRIHVSGEDESVAPSVSLTSENSSEKDDAIVHRLYRVKKGHRHPC